MEFFLLGLLIAVGVLVVLNRLNADRQIERVVEEVQELAGELPEMAERLRSLEERVAAIDLEPLRRELQGLRRQVEELAVVPEPEIIEVEDPAADQAQELRNLLERRLRQRGLSEIQLLGDASTFTQEDFTIAVEAVSEGRVVKGLVHIVGSEIRSIQLDDSLRQFP